MRRNHLNQYQFRYRPTGQVVEHSGYFNDVEDYVENNWSLYNHQVQAVHRPSKRVVGEMLYEQGGPLFEISVDEKHQGRGVGEGMVRHAIKVHEAARRAGADIPRPSSASHETDEGERFGEAMIKKGLFEE